MGWLKILGNIGRRVAKAGEETYGTKKRKKKPKKRKTVKKRKTMKKGTLKKIAGKIGTEALDYYSYKQAKKQIPSAVKYGDSTIKLPTVTTSQDTFYIFGKNVPKKTVYLTGGILAAALIGYKLIKRK